MKIRAKSPIAINGVHVDEGEIVECDVDTANNLIRLLRAEKVDELSAEKVDEDENFGKKQKTKSAGD